MWSGLTLCALRAERNPRAKRRFAASLCWSAKREILRPVPLYTPTLFRKARPGVVAARSARSTQPLSRMVWMQEGSGCSSTNTTEHFLLASICCPKDTVSARAP